MNDQSRDPIDADYIARQKAWSEHTFGPGPRTLGILDHIRKELVEIEDAPDDLMEWVDVILLALDGAWRAGHHPAAILDAMHEKQKVLHDRAYPDWREYGPDQAIEHIRETA